MEKNAVAATSYGRVYEHTGGYFPGINAATMRLVAGETERARKLAGDILAGLAGLSATNENEEAYYREATAAEAMAILGDQDGARGALRRAKALLGDDLAAGATTRQQIRRVCQVLDLDAAMLDELIAPGMIHYCGHMIAPAGQPGRFDASGEDEVAALIDAYLDRNNIGFAYGSLACGTDILFAEAMIARGAEYSVVLPFRISEFIEISVRPGGDQWVDRFQHCLDNASSMRFASILCDTQVSLLSASVSHIQPDGISAKSRNRSSAALKVCWS